MKRAWETAPWDNIILPPGVKPTKREEHPLMTNNFGCPIGNDTNALQVNGHVLASDSWLMEKQQMFNRSKIVERMVHPCGSGAFGYFEVTRDMTKYCKANFLDTVGKKTPVFARFSTVTLGREFPDSARNPRGFAVKFYTEEGNYDLVGLNFPIFFVRDPAQGPDVIRSQQKNPKNFLIDYNSWFDFISLVPESLHCATMMFSDYGTPIGWRHMHGYGVHTFKWVNAKGEAVYVKYHWICEDTRNFTWEEARKMCGEDPDFAKRDLWEYIEKGNEAVWKACVQIIPVSEVEKCQFDPFDPTKIWCHNDYPLIEYGRLVLNRNPENYHRDVEQVAFSPGSLVPGIEPSPDPLLQFRMFFYRDAQMYRLGRNMHQIPVNCPYMSKLVTGDPTTRDGPLRCDFNGAVDGTTPPNYYPNSYSGAPMPDPKYDWTPEKIREGAVMARKSSSKHAGRPADEYIQVRELYEKVMTPEQRKNLHANMGDALKQVKPHIQKNMLVRLYCISAEYAKGVGRYLEGIDWQEIEERASSAR